MDKLGVLLVLIRSPDALKKDVFMDELDADGDDVGEEEGGLVTVGEGCDVRGRVGWSWEGWRVLFLSLLRKELIILLKLGF